MEISPTPAFGLTSDAVPARSVVAPPWHAAPLYQACPSLQLDWRRTSSHKQDYARQPTAGCLHTFFLRLLRCVLACLKIHALAREPRQTGFQLTVSALVVHPCASFGKL